MLKKQSGFTMVELMITMVIFVIVIVAASNIFTSMLGQFKQQSSIAETNIEGIVGLELLRADIEQAGFGLPWVLDGVNYTEAADDGNTTQDDTFYNDDNGGANGNPPRAFVHGDGEGFNGSDVLVIKATNVAVNDAAHRYTYITNSGATNSMNIWRDIAGNTICDENLRPMPSPPAGCNNAATDRVIALNPVSGNSQRILITTGPANFTTNFNPSAAGFAAGFQPDANSFNTYLIYGINSNTAANPRMPFNRADYYVRTPPNMPTRCATGTGILFKGVINHADGFHTGNELPLIDCVADFQVGFRLDIDNNGIMDTDGIPALANAETIRNQVGEVRVFILAHEGQRDTSYTFTNFTGTATCATCITVGDVTFGRDFDLSAITDYLNYRWKVYTMVLKPYNLR